MNIKPWHKYIFAGLVSLLSPLASIQASALFDGTAADAWLIDPQTGQVVGYDLGNGWLNQFVANDFSALNLSNGNAILINNLPNSSVPMSAGQPSISLTGIGNQAISVGQGAINDLRLTPASATYNDTIEVKISVSAALFSQSTYQLLWTVGTQPQKSIALNSQSVANTQDGYFIQSIFLAADGVYAVDVVLKNSSGVTVATAMASYEIDTCFPPMDAQACADKLHRDSDGDGIPDLVELDIGLNPLTNDWNADLNGDGWSEFDTWLRRFCLDPNTQQPLDGNSCLDANGLPLDTDKDDWSDFDEILRGTNPNDPQPYASTSGGTVPDFTVNPGTGVNVAGFCVDDARFYFDIQLTTSKTNPDPSVDIAFAIAADGSLYVRPVEEIVVNFQPVTGEITRQAPVVVTYPDLSTGALPAKDRFVDGAIADFNLELVGPGRWRMTGSAAHGADRFSSGDQVQVVAFREFGPLTNYSGDTYTIDTCAVNSTPESNADFFAALRFKDFPAATRLYEVEHVLDNASLVAPPAASLTLDQQSLGAKQAEYDGVVVQSYTATQDNIAGVYVFVAADQAEGVDDITLNIWADSLRGTLLFSQTLKNVVINKQTDTTISYLFDAIPQQAGQVYYLEFRKKKAKLVSTGLDTYAGGSVLEKGGLPAAGPEDIKFATYYDTSFANGIGGTRENMSWKTAVASGINGKRLYNSASLLSNDEIALASLTPGEIAARRRGEVASGELSNSLLPAMRLPAGNSVVVSASHRYDYRLTPNHDTPLSYERVYKQWLPRLPDVTPVTMLTEVGQGSWTTPEEWRNAFVAYLLPRLTLQSSPQLDVDSTVSINAIEAVLSEESVLQGLSIQQLFAASIQTGSPQFAKAWEQSLRRFTVPDYSLDQSILDIRTALATGQLLSSQGDWLRTTFFSSKPGTRSDEYIARRFHQNYQTDCFISDASVAALQADTVLWNAFFDRCPDYFSETKRDQYLADDQLRRYQLRLILLPAAPAALLAYSTLLELNTDTDTDGLDNQTEIEQPVNNLTLPWLDDVDADGVADGIDPCPNDRLNECSSNPVLPVITADSDMIITEPFTGSNVAIIAIRLDRIYDKAITVYYEALVATGDTATAGQDFTAFTGSVVIAPGQQSALVEVPVFADGDTEGSETFSFQITGVNNATIGDDGIVLITLNDPGLPLTIGGNVSGLVGNLVLQNNNGDNLSLNTDGNFSFATAIGESSSYSVSVFTQPVGQLCTVSHFSGTATVDVTDVAVNCSTSSSNYTIGGSVSGLTGTVILQNNNADDLSLNADGSFTFVTAIGDGLMYNVSVLTQPAGQVCTPTSNSGTVSGSNIIDVDISCSVASLPAAPGNVTVTANNPKTLSFSWNAAAGATSYKLLNNPDGVSGYSEVSTGITALTVDDVIPVHLHDWVNATYMVQACNAAGCTDSAVISTTSAMIATIGYFKASNTGAGDLFGWSVVLSDDGSTLAVGALSEDSAAIGIDGNQSDNAATDAGAVYVFTRSVGSWIQQAYIKASNTDANDGFGYALALSADGNTLAVGAIGEDSNATVINGNQGNNNNSLLSAGSGAVYVFTRSAGSWSQQAYIKASDSSGGDLFGNAIALSADGNTLAVGAINEDSSEVGVSANGTYNFSASNSGAVYVFTRTANSWSQQAYVKASNTGTQDQFGGVVALSDDGNTLAVAARNESSTATGINGDQSDNTASQAGAAYVFTRSAGSWSQQAYIKASNTESIDQFGYGLALSGDGNTLAVGAIDESSSATGIDGDQTSNSTTHSGAAYVFTRSVGSWSQQAYIKASNPDESDEFSWSLALSADGNTLAVGSAREQSSAIGINGNQSSNIFNNAGAVYVFKRDNSNSWSQRAYVKASNAWAADAFGRSVSLSADGDSLAVGAIYEGSNATGINGDQGNDAVNSAGAGYVY